MNLKNMIESDNSKIHVSNNSLLSIFIEFSFVLTDGAVTILVIKLLFYCEHI